MSEQILWYSSSVPLSHNGEKRDKRSLPKEQGVSARSLRLDFAKWAIKTGRSVRCGGHAMGSVSGIGMSFHNGKCCEDFLHKWRVPVAAAFRDYIISGECSKEGIEAHAEFSLRLYQRFKSDCKPYSKSGVNKADVAKYRAYRQEWVDFLKYWEENNG